MVRRHEGQHAADNRSALGAHQFSDAPRAKYLLRDHNRILRSGSLDSVTRIPAAQVPHGAEVISERDSVRLRWSDSAGGFVLVSND